MDLSFYQSETSQKFREEGREQGRRQMWIIDILRLRDINLSDAERERIFDCEDIDQLNAWFERAVNASAAADVFGER